ncbi:hypothetical protein AB0395_11465 [Streptosporangium sp. NPDC051023]|uniref:hypothetical protein n=1 Tax=Streptosporangium sp. NPDC051023 TaxID=3155410 RepID=UPI00344E257E
MLDRHLSPAVRRPVAALIAILASCAGLGAAAPTALPTPAMSTASVGDCGTLTFSGSAFGYLDNGTLSAGFCVGLRSVRRINVAYDKAKGGSTNIRLGYQQTDSSGVGIKRPVYASALTATPGNTAFKTFSLSLPQGCYHGVMLNTATRYQYVTKVWGEC